MSRCRLGENLVRRSRGGEVSESFIGAGRPVEKAPPQALLAWPTGGWRLEALEHIPARTRRGPASGLRGAWLDAITSLQPREP
jgi:hypothetical protein